MKLIARPECRTFLAESGSWIGHLLITILEVHTSNDRLLASTPLTLTQIMPLYSMSIMASSESSCVPVSRTGKNKLGENNIPLIGYSSVKCEICDIAFWNWSNIIEQRLALNSHLCYKCQSTEIEQNNDGVGGKSTSFMCNYPTFLVWQCHIFWGNWLFKKPKGWLWRFVWWCIHYLVNIRYYAGF